MTFAASSAYAQSPFAEGRWVKIRVDETGIQQITFDQLRQWGFSEPEKVTVYGFGGAAMASCWTPADMPDALPQQYSITRDNRIFFYGESGSRTALIFRDQRIEPGVAPLRNNASQAGYYFLTDSRARETVSTIPYTVMSTTITNCHTSIQIVDHNDMIPTGLGQHYYSYNLLDRPDHRQSYEFSLPDRKTDVSDKVNITNVVGATGSSPTFTRTFSNGSTLSSSTLSLSSKSSELTFDNNYGKSSAYSSYSLDPSLDTYSYSVTPSTSGDITWAGVYYTGIHYMRSNVLRDPQMTMIFRSVEKGDPIFIDKSGRSSNIQVWKIESACKVRPFNTHDNSTGGMYFTPDKDYQFAAISEAQASYMRVVAFDPSDTQYEVAYAGEVSDAGLYDEVPQLLIVTSELCAPQAERLAEIHRQYLNHTVKVVKEADIFNEFSSGTPAVNALRRYAGWLASQPESKFRHILIFGATSNDLRGLNGTAALLRSQGNLTLTYPTYNHENQRSNIKSYTSDIYFGIVDKDMRSERAFLTSHAKVNVGRIPAQDLSQATLAVDKIYNYLTRQPDSDVVNRVLLLSDAGDGHSHLNNSEGVYQQFADNDPGTTTVKVYNAFYPLLTSKAPMVTAALTQALQMGVGMFNFSGHGKPDAFTRQNVWTLADNKAVDYTLFPIGVFATCDSYMFDQLITSLAEEMVFKPNGGVIAAIGACRTVYEAKNQSLNREIGRLYSLATDATTTGDLFREAVNNVISSFPTDMQLLTNDRCYNLCGDPALPLYTASRNGVGIVSINSEPYGSSAMTTLNALSPNTIEGVIYASDGTGAIDTGFNGEVILTLYESPRYIATTDNTSSTANILVDEDQIVSVKAPVTDGHFSLSLTTPMPTRGTVEGHEYNRMTMLAISDDNRRRLKGHTTGLIISREYPGEIADTEAPAIESFYIDDQEFNDGDAVAGSLTFRAVVGADPSGLRLSTGSIGGSIRIVIDGSRILPVLGSAISFKADGSAEIALDATDFSDGNHQAVLYISDNAGNTASASVNFTVVNRSGSAELAVEESPARIQATISLVHTYPGQPAGRLVIEDTEGNTVKSVDSVTFPYEWDLTDGEKPVADGIYRAYAIFRSGNSFGATPKTEIIVVQKQ